MKFTFPDYRLFQLKQILININSDKLYDPDVEKAKTKEEKIVENIYQARTMRRKIIDKIEEANKTFEEKAQKIMEKIMEFQKKSREVMIEQGLPTNVMGAKLDDLTKQMPPKGYEEYNKWQSENSIKLSADIRKEFNLLALYYTCKQKNARGEEFNIVLFYPITPESDKDDKKKEKSKPEEKMVDLILDDTPHKQGEYLKELFTTHVYSILDDEDIGISIGKALGCY